MNKSKWSYFKNFASINLFIFSRQITYVGSGSNVSDAETSSKCSDYTVKEGDDLRIIALQNLGSGTKYTEIMTQNVLATTLLHIGQILKLDC